MRSASAVEIDGSYGEGGGSVVRTALAVSTLTNQPVAIRNVRGGLRRQGVNPIDVALARSLGEATGAEFSAQLGDEVLLFAPSHDVKPYRDRIDLNSIAKGSQPASAAIIFQGLLAPLARSGGISRLECRGGTHVPFSPTYEYFRAVTLPAFARAGIVAFPSMAAAGYSPRGGGEVQLEIEPSHFNGFAFEDRGALQAIKGFVVTSELPESVSKRGAERLQELARNNDLELTVEVLRPRSPAPGAAVTMGALFENAFGGSQSLGQRGKPMEEVVEEAFFECVMWLNGKSTTDEFLADQLLLPAAFCGQACSYTTSRVTQTLLTTAWVIKQFMPAKITILGSEGQPGEIRVAV